MKGAAFSRFRTLLVGVIAIIVGNLGPSLHAREVAGEIFANGPADGGRLYIKRSPVLAYDISITIMIDGKVAGTLVYARVFDRYLKPGRHVVEAVPNQLRGKWTGVIDVQAGKTYTYVTSYVVNRIQLDRVRPVR